MKTRRKQASDRAKPRRFQGDRKLTPDRQQLVEQWLPLVLAIAKQYNCAYNKDIISEGQLGLIDAAILFDEDRGVQFNTYAYWAIRNRILFCLEQSIKKSAKEASFEEFASVPVAKDPDAATRPIDRTDEIEHIKSLISEEDWEVVAEYYGLDGKEQVGLLELSQRKQVSRQAAHQRLTRVLKNIRKHFEEIK